MYSFMIDDSVNALEPRGVVRELIDKALEEGVEVEADRETVDQRAIDAAAVKDAMFGGVSY